MNETNIAITHEESSVLYQEKKNNFLYIKRFSDVFLSAIALIILSPLFLVISILIKLDSKGSVFFKHKRVGKNGKEIGVYKFRTMVENAEELLKTLSPKEREEFEENFKMKDDFRITKIGKFLRKTSLDELPQLINILMGDMSIVGPRPIVKKELEKYGMLKKHFLSVTPGLTGYWACNGRSNTTYDERIKMELYYVNNMSVWLDVKIIFKTIIGVLKGNGAE